MKQIHSFDEIQFHFDSGQIPPPFCHRYSLLISRISSGSFNAYLKLEYYGREDISEEEVLEEGFTMEDDFEWNGDFPEIWIDPIIKKLNSANWVKKVAFPGDQSTLPVKIMLDGMSEVRYPAESRIWVQFIQELIQVVFESAKKEAPLNIQFVSIAANNQKDQVEFTYVFATRSVQIKSNRHQLKTIEWSEGQQLLKYIFGLDYLPEEGLDKIPSKQGDYISPGDGWWYQLSPIEGAAKKNEEKITRLIEALKKFV